MMGRFAMVPEAALRDRRLSLRDFLVLSALCLCVDRRTGSARPSRQRLAELTGIHISHITRITTRLARLGWLHKSGNGGRTTTARYIIFECPQTYAETYAETCAVLAQNLRRFGTETYAKTAQGQTIEQTSKENLKIKRKGGGGTRAARTPARTPTREAADPAPPPPSQPALPAGGSPASRQKTGGWVDAQRPDDLEQELWDDWCRQRTKHRWHLSDRAVAGIRSQARAVGITLQDAVELMLVNDWRGFNARWESVRAAVGVQGQQRFQTARERDLESVRQQHKEMYGDWWGEWEKERGALPGLPSQQVFDVPALVMEQQKNG